jgi:hypothetical protein
LLAAFFVESVGVYFHILPTLLLKLNFILNIFSISL